MIHKRRATPSLESGGGERTTVVIDNGERRTPGAGTAFPRFGFPAREESRGSSGGTWAGRGGGGGSGSNGRGGLYRRKGGVESPSRSPSSAAKGKRRRGPAGGSMYWSRSIWFRVLCVTGGGFLLLMTGARRMGYSLSATTTRRRAAIVAAAAAREREMDADMGVEAELQERRLRMAMKHKTFETTPHTLKDLLELDSSFSRRGCSNDSIDVTAIIVGSSSLDAQLNALLGGSVQPTQVWVVMPTIGTAAYRATVSRHQKGGGGQLEGRLHVVESDLFSDQPSGMTARDSRGVGGSDSGSFFDEKTGLFQLAMQAATKFVWIIDPGVLPGSKFLHLLAHVSTIKGMAGVYGSEGALMPAAPARGWRTANQDRHPGPPEDLPFALWNTGPDTAAGPHPAAAAAGKSVANGTPPGAEPGVAAAAAAALASRGGMAVGGAAGSDTRAGGVPVSVLSPVDVLFSQWFLDKDLVRLLFREKWLALGSGDGDPTGLALSYSVRRYAGVPSFVLPSHADLPEYSGDTRTTASSASAPAASAVAVTVAGLPAAPAAGTSSTNNNNSNSKQGSSARAGAAARSSGKGSGGRPREKKKKFSSRKSNNRHHNNNNNNNNKDDKQGGGADDRSNPRSRRLSSVGDVVDGVVPDREAPAGAPAGSAASLVARRLNAPALSAQFRELSSRAGQFFWTPERCPKELVLLVVDGRRQAELLEPVYRALVESLAAAEDGDGDGDGDGGADGGGAEVFVAVITQGPDESEQGGRPPQPARRTARRDCTEVAEALAGVINGDGGNTANHVVSNDDDDDDSARRRRASKAFGAGRGHAPRWLRGYAEGGDDRKSRHLLSPEEFCLGSAFGVFQIRAGQDYRQAKGRPLDPYLEVFHGLSEVLEVARPKVVAYIASPPSRISPGGEASGGVRKPNPSKGDRAGVDEMLATASTGYDPEDTVVRAVEAALRSAADEGGGGASYSYRPIGVGLPPAEAGADAAKALAYLPAGCLELWDKPSITLVLVHPGGEDGGLLARTLRALSEAHYVGDRVELRLVLGARDASDPRINQIVRDLEWRWGDLDVTYFSDADGGGGNRLPAGLAALEAFADPKAHDHIVPLFSGGIPDPNFYVWLKVALINDGYAPLPVAGLPLTSQRLKRSLGFHVGRESSSNYGGGSSSGGGGLPPEDRGGTRTRIERRRLTANGGGGNDPGKMWGKFLSLSVDIPQGLCPAGRDGGCSRVWMYGSEAWGALRERCRVGLASELVGGGVGGEREGARGGGRGHGHRQGGLEPLEIACAVGDVAEWKGAEWGLEARRVCGAGPRDDGGSSSGGGGKWQRARVWEVYPLQQGR